MKVVAKLMLFACMGVMAASAVDGALRGDYFLCSWMSAWLFIMLWCLFVADQNRFKVTKRDDEPTAVGK